jgi:hypothetical protein
MFLIITFRKSFKNVITIPFFELFGQEHKFETWFENFLGDFFLKVILRSLYLIFYIKWSIE